MKIIAIVPYRDLAEEFSKTFLDHCRRESISKYSNHEFELEIIVKHDDFMGFKADCDVIIARGDSVYTLREMLDIPIVEIPLGAYSVEQAILEAINLYRPANIGIIGFVNLLVEIEQLSIVSGVNIKHYFITSRSQLEDAVGKALADGVDVVICGVNGQLVAGKLGCKSVLLKTHKQEIWHAITEAKRSAYVYNIQKLETERFKNISDYSFDGILTVDQSNNIVSFNNAAQLLLLDAVYTDEVPAKIAAVLKKTKLDAIIRSDDACTDEIVKFGTKLLTVNSIPVIVRNENRGKVVIFQDSTRIQKLENKIRKTIYARGHIAKYTFKDILGTSSRIRESVNIARDYSLVDSNILIIGGTGTGKELFAQSIHNNSKRRNGPFVAVNCAAIPDNLMESELFGYVEGAFTGALKRGKTGYFELAHGGTIFLDEISEISLSLQGRLLRVIQEKEVVKIGDDRVTPVDVRIIAASNKDLQTLSDSNDFRQDLYYRLDVLRIQIPLLNERREDIPLLIRKFVSKYCRKFELDGLKIEEDALEFLGELDWKGNVRQLCNVCERMVVTSQNGSITRALAERVTGKNLGRIMASESKAPAPGNLQVRLDYTEKIQIQEYMEQSGRDINQTAKKLGISRATLYRRLNKYKLI